MARRINNSDEALLLTIREALSQSQDQDLDCMADSILSAIKPSVGSAAITRRISAALVAAFRDGFQTGQKVGRFARWHQEYWTYSSTAIALREPTKNDPSRYARYNYD